MKNIESILEVTVIPKYAKVDLQLSIRSTKLSCKMVQSHIYSVHVVRENIYVAQSVVYDTKLNVELITNMVIVLPRKVYTRALACTYNISLTQPSCITTSSLVEVVARIFG